MEAREAFMSNTGIQSTARQTASASSLPKPRQKEEPNLVVRLLTPLASLRLTVVLFVLAFLLVFCGTLAQVDLSNWTVVKTYFRSLLVWIPFQVFVRFGQTFFYIPKAAEVPGSFPFPGGWLLGGLLLANLLAAHAVRFKLNWKRSGIFILHAGVIVLMLSELVTGLFAIEGNMSIETGKSSNYLVHATACELAVIDTSDPQIDDVVVVPGSLLRKEALITHDDLPFNVEPVQFMVNSEVQEKIPSKADNPATAGEGLAARAIEKKEGSGVDPEQRSDVPSAYVTFRRKDNGQSLGTYLVSVWLNEPQTVTVDGKKYDLSLRFKHTYKPYTIYLKEFHHGVYMGTDVPKDYSSKVRLVDPTSNDVKEVTISMNAPLRYGGETFYQSGVLGADKGTILQVVHNPGWLLPYIACAMVVVGMAVHFGIHLFGFLRKRLEGVV
jgi:hypothetical protein